ncbi:MAG: 2-C-methyl-D-erythritol 4-phosphate cytidylyltransferase, partial [Nitrospinae bacterium]|nr:2-C-methyl-D-erythritol 4-phosphate cytidylyltransferase [Nitrospinota bacterium]
EGVFQIQTPQCFKADILRQAVARALAEGFEATDEATLAERIGVKVAVAAGSPLNFKITTGADAALAAMLLRANATEPS